VCLSAHGTSQQSWAPPGYRPELETGNGKGAGGAPSLRSERLDWPTSSRPAGRNKEH
jgi:hypothetical protein